MMDAKISRESLKRNDLHSPKYLLQDTYHPKGEDSNLTKTSRSASPEEKQVNIRNVQQDALRKAEPHTYSIDNW